MDSFTERRLLRGLIGGFALVLLLLGIAGAVAVQGARAIEDNTAKVAREQLVSDMNRRMPLSSGAKKNGN